MTDIEPSPSQFLVYADEAGQVKIDVRFDGGTVWLSQQQLAELFGTSRENITQHVSNIISEGELSAPATSKEFLLVRQEGSREVARSITHYNLDMIISVGYRVRSKTATQFRIWATAHLRELIVKGFVLDDERLANPDVPFDYFDELLERIQAIRTSQRRFYQKITDVYATSLDYDASVAVTQTFFATVQNKLHWAITGQTADGFITLNDRDILRGAGRVSAELAETAAKAEFQQYCDAESAAHESDFDRFVEQARQRAIVAGQGES